ncbi:site-specific integrase [Brachybacterium sp. MASK1Z-5]|uniref:Site-specific integrase n=1 Tax=Brachybacterium halotolerans TaxID=2795215 RepID=A0ABS1BCX3_9MICO|nr:site-specific integrase [Brachybacterium halotolerans]
MAEAEEQAEAKKYAGIPREWTAFARNHREYVLSDDADYSDGTQRIYREGLDNHFLSEGHRFDGRRLDSITHGELRDWLQDIANERGDGAAHTARSLVGMIYRRALTYGVVVADPAARLGKVKRSRRTAQRLQREAEERAKAEGTALEVPKDHQRALSHADLERLFAYLEQSKVAQRNMLLPIARLMFGTGLRIGEVLALTWEHVHLEAAQPSVTVAATVARKDGEGLQLQDHTKTATGMRRVPISPSLAKMLREAKARDRARAKLEPTWNPLGLAFPSERGTIRDRSNVHNRFRKAFDDETVSLQWATPHVFRRTYATTLLLLGRSPLEVAALLGHTDPSFTLKVYGDWQSTPDIAGSVLEELFTITPSTNPVTKAVTEGEELAQLEA